MSGTEIGSEGVDRLVGGSVVAEKEGEVGGNDARVWIVEREEKRGWLWK